MQNGLSVYTAVITHLCMMHVCLLQILMCGTLIVVPQSISLRSVICSLLLNLPLQGILSHVPTYLVEGVGKIVLAAAIGDTFILKDALYVPGIKKNLLSVSAL